MSFLRGVRNFGRGVMRGLQMPLNLYKNIRNAPVIGDALNVAGMVNPKVGLALGAIDTGVNIADKGLNLVNRTGSLANRTGSLVNQVGRGDVVGAFNTGQQLYNQGNQIFREGQDVYRQGQHLRNRF
jgi:hypothetical protein